MLLHLVGLTIISIFNTLICTVLGTALFLPFTNGDSGQSCLIGFVVGLGISVYCLIRDGLEWF